MNTESNKIIAEFMGVFDKILSTGNIHSWSDAPFYYTTEDSKEKVMDNISKYAKYQSDWNWLMEVVEKIESLEVVVEIRENVCYIETSPNNYYSELEDTKLQATYRAVVEFIKWYNKHNIK